MLPNRLQTPLTAEERLAEQYHDHPARLMDLAAATGNRTLYWIARDLLRKEGKTALRSRAGTFSLKMAPGIVAEEIQLPFIT